MSAVQRRLQVLPRRHPLPGAGGRRTSARRGLLPGPVHDAGPGEYVGGLPLQEEQGEWDSRESGKNAESSL